MIFTFLLLNVLFLSTMPIMAYAMNDNFTTETRLCAGLAIAGVATVGTLIAGIRYLLLGNSVSGLISEGTAAGNALINNVETSSNLLINNTEAAGTRLIDHAGTSVDQRVQTITAAVDDRIVTVTDQINPIRQVQKLSDNATYLIKRVLNKANDALNSNSGFSNLEDELKIRLHTGLQKALADLERTSDVNAALQNMRQEELEWLQEYTVISREPSTTGSVEMHSVLEPFVSFYDFWVLVDFCGVAFVLLIISGVLLKMAD